MDYFSIIILVIITFIYITDRKIKSIEDIIKQNGNNDIIKKLKKVKEKIFIVNLDFENISLNTIKEIVNNNNEYEYFLLQNKLLKTYNKFRDVLIANFINNKEKISGFNLRYNTNTKWIINFKKIYLNVLNYLNIFNRNDITTYGVIILKRKDIKYLMQNDSRIVCKNIISYTYSKTFNIEINIDNIINKNKLNCIFKKIFNCDFKIVLKFLLLIFTGYLITSKLLISFFSITENFSIFFIATIVYICYAYILKYIYEPIGKSRIISSYLFIIFFLIYPFILSYMHYLNNKNISNFK